MDTVLGVLFSLFSDLFYSYKCFAFMYVCEPHAYLVSTEMMSLPVGRGIKPGSFERTSALYHQANSPAPSFYFYLEAFFLYLPPKYTIHQQSIFSPLLSPALVTYSSPHVSSYKFSIGNCIPISMASRWP